MRNWLTQFGRLRSLKMCSQQMRELGELMAEAGEDQCPSMKTGREREFLTQSFNSIQAFSGLDELYPHEGQKSALLSIGTEVLISSRNIFTDIPSNKI